MKTKLKVFVGFGAAGACVLLLLFQAASQQSPDATAQLDVPSLTFEKMTGILGVDPTT
jgi:hypothetical protein